MDSGEGLRFGFLVVGGKGVDGFWGGWIGSFEAWKLGSLEAWGL